MKPLPTLLKRAPPAELESGKTVETVAARGQAAQSPSTSVLEPESNLHPSGSRRPNSPRPVNALYSIREAPCSMLRPAQEGLLSGKDLPFSPCWHVGQPLQIPLDDRVSRLLAKADRRELIVHRSGSARLLR